MPKKQALVFGALSIALAVSMIGILWLRPRVMPRSAESYAFRAAAENGVLPVLFEMPEFAYPNQHDKPTTRADLDGHVAIVDFVFSQCSTVCPRITAKMVLLERRIPDPALRFVSFSVDPEHDTPEVLARYAAKWNPNETRWLLLATTPKTLDETARGMRVIVEKKDSEKDPILHTSLFFLVDQKHQVRGIYDSDDDAAFERLMRDAYALAGSKLPVEKHAVAENASGEELYMALGCGACHDDKALAPGLAGLVGRDVLLEGGGHVKANEAYVRESIVAPGEKVVAGFLSLMPSYAGELSPAQLDRVVAYVAALSAPAAVGSSEPAAPLEVDPVCGMQVRVSETTPRAEHAGKTFHFCSSACRDRFVARPGVFANPDGGA